ncbi:hypothetical protein Mapa_011527 [Marchantia paleacea]|nr:hypothetical protein Mapa_011527 [Marchantia paleacea]
MSLRLDVTIGRPDNTCPSGGVRPSLSKFSDNASWQRPRLDFGMEFRWRSVVAYLWAPVVIIDPSSGTRPKRLHPIFLFWRHLHRMTKPAYLLRKYAGKPSHK